MKEGVQYEGRDVCNHLYLLMLMLWECTASESVATC